MGVRMDPDWVMLGVRRNDGLFTLFASKDLSHSELSREVEQETAWSSPYNSMQVAVSQTFTLDIKAKTFVMIQANDYPTAIDKLFRMWLPDQPKP